MSLQRFELAYQQGLLAQAHKSLTAFKPAGLFHCSVRHACTLLAKDKQPPESGLKRRLQAAPSGSYLALDPFGVKHEGCCIEGLGRYDSSQGLLWGHSFITAALVSATDAEAYALGAYPQLSERMASEAYPSQASAIAFDLAKQVAQPVKVKALVVDGSFTIKRQLKSLHHPGLSFVGRIRKNIKVVYAGEKLALKHLAERFPPGKAPWYQKLGCDAKRLSVELPVASVQIIIICARRGYGTELSILVTNLDAGVQELSKATKASWQRERLHRILKHNVGAGKCPCQAYSAQLKHLDLALDAYQRIPEQRLRDPSLAVREAQQLAAAKLDNARLTELTPHSDA